MVTTEKDRKYKPLQIPTELYDRLSERKRPGQSFAGVIEELIQKADAVNLVEAIQNAGNK